MALPAVSWILRDIRDTAGYPIVEIIVFLIGMMGSFRIIDKAKTQDIQLKNKIK
jgi:hypothetical protein